MIVRFCRCRVDLLLNVVNEDHSIRGCTRVFALINCKTLVVMRVNKIIVGKFYSRHFKNQISTTLSSSPCNIRIGKMPKTVSRRPFTKLPRGKKEVTKAQPKKRARPAAPVVRVGDLDQWLVDVICAYVSLPIEDRPPLHVFVRDNQCEDDLINAVDKDVNTCEHEAVVPFLFNADDGDDDDETVHVPAVQTPSHLGGAAGAVGAVSGVATNVILPTTTKTLGAGKEEVQCPICMTAGITTYFISSTCAHPVCCTACHSQFKKKCTTCPMCRGDIVEMMKIERK